MAGVNNSFDPAHLLTYELNYEMRLRDLNTFCDEIRKRKALKRTLAQELGRGLVYEDIVYDDFGEEKREIRHSFASLQETINSLDNSNIDDQVVITSRLAHLKGRVNRLPDEPEANSLKSDMRVRILALELDFEEKLGNTTDVVPTPLLSSTPMSAINNQVTTSFHNPVILKTTPVHKWDIKFDGTEETLLDFLERVEELRVSRNVTKENLFIRLLIYLRVLL